MYGRRAPKARPAKAGKERRMNKNDENKPLPGQISMFDSAVEESPAQSCYINSIQGEENYGYFDKTGKKGSNE